MTPLKYSPLRIRRRRCGKPFYDRKFENLRDWVTKRKEIGVGSWEMRRADLPNPSQTAGELVRYGGQALMSVPEDPPNGSNHARGARYFLPDYAPAGATQVNPCAEKHPKPQVLATVPAPVRRTRPKAAPVDIGDLFEDEPTIFDRKVA